MLFGGVNAKKLIIQERTSILIAHRMLTILAGDEILVVKDGRIVKRGTHADLVKAGGVYTELYETQFKRLWKQKETYESANEQEIFFFIAENKRWGIHEKRCRLS